MEQWQREFIRFLFPYSTSRMRIEHAYLAKHPHVPSFLYKYREFKPPHLDALRRGVLYMSSPDRFNDPFDTTVFFRPERFLVEDLPAQEFIERMDEMQRDALSRTPSLPRVINNPIRQGEWIRRVTADILKDAPADKRDALIGIAEKWLRQQNEKLRQQTREWFRSGFSVLSLSANPASILMWSHYSNSHQGFCIEYDFGRLPPDDLRRRLCYPVLYRKKMTDATRYLANTAATDFNNLFGQYLCLLKRMEWAYEKEWRIVHPTGPSLANREFEMPKPRAIILGSAVKPGDMNAMEGYCERHGIALKRAVRNDSAGQIDIVKFK